MSSYKQQQLYLSCQYVFTQKYGSGDYYWEIFKPMKEPLKLPELAVEKPRGVDHYEICHTLGCHYDIIQADGLGSVEHPYIETKHSYFKIYSITYHIKVLLRFPIATFSVSVPSTFVCHI